MNWEWKGEKEIWGETEEWNYWRNQRHFELEVFRRNITKPHTTWFLIKRSLWMPKWMNMIWKVDRFFIFAGVLPFKPNVYFLNHFNFQIVTFCLSPKFADSKTNMKRKRNIFAKYTEITLIAPKTYKHKYLAPILRDIFSQYLWRKKKSFGKIFETPSQFFKASL